MRRKWRILALGMLMGVLAGFLTPVEQAIAAGKCWEISCVSVFAADVGCDADKIQIGGASPKAETGARRDVILWYSNACHALWGYYFSTSEDTTGGFAVYSQSI